MIFKSISITSKKNKHILCAPFLILMSTYLLLIKTLNLKTLKALCIQHQYYYLLQFKLSPNVQINSQNQRDKQFLFSVQTKTLSVIAFVQ